MLNLAEYKILGDGEIKNKLELIVHSISKSARAKIEKAGGKVTEKNNKEEKKKIIKEKGSALSKPDVNKGNK